MEEGSTWDDFHAACIRADWKEATIGDGCMSEKHRFCSDACLQYEVRHERLHRPGHYSAHVSFYDVELLDLPNIDPKKVPMADRHRPAFEYLVGWLLEHWQETVNFTREFACWELRAVHGVDPADPQAMARARSRNGDGKTDVLRFLLWRAERKERYLFSLVDRSGTSHAVWHWSGHGVVCPSLCVTLGNPDSAAKRISGAVLRHGMRVKSDGDVTPDTSSFYALKLQLAGLGTEPVGPIERALAGLPWEGHSDA
jgi:hypothetical protein